MEGNAATKLHHGPASIALAAAAFIGLGVGTFIYRFVFLPLGYDGPFAGTFIAVTTSSLAKGGLLVRGAAPPDGKAAVLAMGMLALALAATVGLAYLLVPPVGQCRFSRRELPGFAIGLPPGRQGPAYLEYAAGRVLVKDVAGSGRNAVVTWSTSGVFGESDLERMSVLGRSFGGVGPGRYGTVPGPYGRPVGIVTMPSKNGTVRFSMLRCGSRNVLVATIGDHDMATIQRRMVVSFECHPDPAKERAARVPPLVLDLPGWFAIHEDDGVLQLTDGESIMLAMTLAPDDEPIELPVVLRLLLAASKLDVVVGTSVADQAPLHGTVNGKAVIGFAKRIHCATVDTLLVELSSDQRHADAASAHLSTARCLEPGEPPQDWRSGARDRPRPGLRGLF